MLSGILKQGDGKNKGMGETQAGHARRDGSNRGRNARSPQLRTTDSVTAGSYDSAARRGLRLKLEIRAVTAPLLSHDQNQARTHGTTTAFERTRVFSLSF